MKEQQENKTSIWYWIIPLIIGIILTFFFGYLINSTIQDIHNYNTYKNFCEDNNTDICYCEGFFVCEFKSSYTNNIPDNNTIELCKIAKSLNDKKVMFKVGCRE